jgi:hypothetical protein
MFSSWIKILILLVFCGDGNEGLVIAPSFVLMVWQGFFKA